MPDRVGDAHAARAGPDGRRVQPAQGVRVRAGRVLGHVHHRHPLADGERDRVLGEPQQLIERPSLGVLTQRARADERAALDRDAGLLADLDDRIDVRLERPRRAVGGDREAGVGDLARQTGDVRRRPRSRAGQPDVRGVDPEPVHEMEDLDLLLDGGIGDRGRLEPVAERLVVELDGLGGLDEVARLVVPVVDQVFAARLVALGVGHRRSPLCKGFRR